MSREISRQAKSMQKAKENGICTKCYKNKIERSKSCWLCISCLEKRREQQRLKKQVKKRQPRFRIDMDSVDWSKSDRQLAEEWDCQVDTVTRNRAKFGIQIEDKVIKGFLPISSDGVPIYWAFHRTKNLAMHYGGDNCKEIVEATITYKMKSQ